MTVMGGDAGDAAWNVLLAHRAISHDGACACGFRPGDTDHAQHQLHQLQMAGLDVVWR